MLQGLFGTEEYSSVGKSRQGEVLCASTPTSHTDWDPHHTGYTNSSMVKPKHPRISMGKPLPAQAKGS